MLFFIKTRLLWGSNWNLDVYSVFENEGGSEYSFSENERSTSFLSFVPYFIRLFRSKYIRGVKCEGQWCEFNFRGSIFLRDHSNRGTFGGYLWQFLCILGELKEEQKMNLKGKIFYDLICLGVSPNFLVLCQLGETIYFIMAKDSILEWGFQNEFCIRKMNFYTVNWKFSKKIPFSKYFSFSPTLFW